MLRIMELIPVQELDLKIDEAKKQIEAKKQKYLRMKKDVEGEAELLEKKSALLKNIKLRKLKAEHEVEDLNSKIKVTELKMQNAGVTPKDYSALEKMLNTYKAQADEHETKILSDMEKIEALTADIEKSTKVVAGRKEHLGMVKTRIQEEVIGDKKQLELIVTERKQASQKVDTSVLVKYEDLRNRKKGQVLFGIESPACPKCGMGVPAGVLGSIKTTVEAEACDNCGVYLYWTGPRE